MGLWLSFGVIVREKLLGDAEVNVQGCAQPCLHQRATRVSAVRLCRATTRNLAMVWSVAGRYFEYFQARLAVGNISKSAHQVKGALGFAFDIMYSDSASCPGTPHLPRLPLNAHNVENIIGFIAVFCL